MAGEHIGELTARRKTLEPETHSETLGRNERMSGTFSLQESIRRNGRRQTAGVCAESVIANEGLGKVQR